MPFYRAAARGWHATRPRTMDDGAHCPYFLRLLALRHTAQHYQLPAVDGLYDSSFTPARTAPRLLMRTTPPRPPRLPHCSTACHRWPSHYCDRITRCRPVTARRRALRAAVRWPFRSPTHHGTAGFHGWWTTLAACCWDRIGCCLMDGSAFGWLTYGLLCHTAILLPIIGCCVRRLSPHRATSTVLCSPP